MRVCCFVYKCAPGSVSTAGGGARGTGTDVSGALESRSCVRCVVSRITRADTSRTITIDTSAGRQLVSRYWNVREASDTQTCRVQTVVCFLNANKSAAHCLERRRESLWELQHELQYCAVRVDELIAADASRGSLYSRTDSVNAKTAKNYQQWLQLSLASN